MNITVVGYGCYEGRTRQGEILEVTRKVIYLRVDGIKERYRTRDGKRENDNFRSGWRLATDDLKKACALQAA